MTERERKILMGESIEPRTADENAYANVSGGGGALEFVEFSYDGETATCNKTFSEIENMTLPIGILNGQGLSALAQRSGLHGKEFTGSCVLDKIGAVTGKYFVVFRIMENGTINVSETDLAE